MPASTQVAIVPAEPKSTSSGCARTHSTRSTSVRGVAEAGKVMFPVVPRRALQRAAARTEDEQGQLGAVGAELGGEALQDLALAGQHEAGAAGGHTGLADLLRDRGAFFPQCHERRVDLV